MPARPFALIAGLTLPLLTAGCFSTASTSGAPNSSVATWRMPWQLNPTSAAHPERTQRIYVADTGYVRGTPAALASIGRPLQPAGGYNHTVQTCRDTVASEAEKLGGHQVEAVSAGQDVMNSRGQYVGPVLFRINYRRAGGYEVRMAMLTCVVDRNNKIVDAYARGRRRA